MKNSFHVYYHVLNYLQNYLVKSKMVDHIWAITTDANEHGCKMTLAVFKNKIDAIKFLEKYGFQIDDLEEDIVIETNTTHIEQVGLVQYWYYKNGDVVYLRIERFELGKMLIASHNE